MSRNNDAMDPSKLLNRLTDILDSDPHIDEVGFIHPSQFAALSGDVQVGKPVDGINSELETARASCSDDTFFWHGEHKLGIGTHVLAPLYVAAKHAFMDGLKQYRLLLSHLQNDEVLDDNLDAVGSDLMKYSRALVLLSCDYGTAWNFRKLFVSKKQLLTMLMDELRLSRLILSYAPKSERAWSHRRWVIRMMAEKYPNLQEIVDRESELVKSIAENSKMNYRSWNHRCWLVSYMSDSQVICELQTSRDWGGLHVADNSCFHYRARLLLRMVETVQHTHVQDAFSVEKVHQMWKRGEKNYNVFAYKFERIISPASVKMASCAEELDWVGSLIRRYVGREALWLHRRFLSLLWMKHLVINDQSTSQHRCCGNSEICDVNAFVANEFVLFHSCTTIPDTEFGDHQAQATHSATYIMWLAKQFPLSFGTELQRGSHNDVLKTLLHEADKSCLWDALTSAHA